MSHRPSVLLGLLALTAGAAVVATAGSAQAAPTTCAGKAGTIVATTTEARSGPGVLHGQ